MGHADLILINVKIVTVDERDTIAEAVAIEDEKIVEVGTTEEVKKLGTMNLEGKTVLPGFEDAHAHLGI